MPQVIVDTATESPASLALLSRLFQDYAMLKAKDEQQARTEYPALNTPQLDAETRSPVPLVSMPTAAAAETDAEAIGTAIHAELEADPSKLFAANRPNVTNILNFPQPTLPATSATAPSVTSGTADTSAAAPVVVPQGTELDSAQVPWDSRIHSSAKGKKQDGTWKLARNIDKALVTMVLQEITPKPHVVNGQVVPVGAVPPVSLTVTVPAASTPVPVPPVAPLGTGAVPVPAVGTGSAPVPVPPVPAVGAVPAAPLNPVQQFQAFMKLVAEGQASVPPKFSHADVVAACVAEGVAQLQLVIMAPDKIPAIKARLGLV